MVQLLLPSGATRLLRALVDTGATDDFIHERLVAEFKLSTRALPKKVKVNLGSGGSCAYVKDETTLLTSTLGPAGTRKSRYTVLDLGEYDIILGRPFQKSTASRIEGDDVYLPSKHGYQPVPRWVNPRVHKTKVVKTSYREMHSVIRNSKETYVLQFTGVTPEAQELLVTPPTKPTRKKPTRKRLMALLEEAIKKVENDERRVRTELPHKRPELETRLKEKRVVFSSQDSEVPRAEGMPELEKLLKEYGDVFPKDLPAEPPPDREFSMRIEVKEGTTPPAQAPYRTPADAQSAIQQTLDYLYSHGFARDSISEYAAPVTLAKKADGTWRFCVDYRKLNSITKEAKYPLPRIEDCLDKLGKAKYFSKLDLRSGYWQVKIAEKDIEKTAFRTQNGHHEWIVMPFGLQGAPSCFQRMMNHYLRHYIGKFIIVYLDDILVYSNTAEEHLEHLRTLLQVLREKQLFAKGSKCDLFRTSVGFLGYVVQNGSITTDPAKIKAVREWPIPTTVREVRSFLGLCNFYRKFIKDHASIAKPLTNVLKSTEFKEKFGTNFTKTAPVTLGELEIKAFEALKQALSSAPCLAIYDPDKPTEVWADASWENSTTGAVLLQDHGSGLQPVAFISKVMNAAESRYPTFEQELLALKRAFEEWRHYLLPLHFKARTDHNGLKYLRTQKNLSERQWHWLAFFSEFYFDLDYRAGKKMVVPDSLSRKPLTNSDIEDMLRLKHQEDTSFDIEIPIDGGRQKVCLVLNLKHRQRALASDHEESLPEKLDYTDCPDYAEVYSLLTSSNTSKELPPSCRMYAVNGKGNLIWLDKRMNDRVCVPKKYRAVIMAEHHDTPLGGHFGADKVYHSTRQRFIWPHMRHVIQQYVYSCDACQKNKASHKKPLGQPQLPELPTEPWQWVSLDFCGPFPKTKRGNDYVLGVVCNLTRQVIFIPCTTETSAKRAVDLYVRYVFPRTGLPTRITSDRGPQFVSNFWELLWTALDTKVALTAPYHPSSNALIERQNDTFQESLRSFVNARQDDWDDCLILYEFAYNNTVNPSTGETPFYLNHGRHPRMPVAQLTDTASPAVNDYVQHMHNVIAEARDHIMRHQGDAADRRVDDFVPSDLEVGDKVLLNTANYNLQLPSRKLAPKWIGPLKVLQRRGPNTVLIEVPPRLSRIEPLQNVQWLKKYVERKPDVGPEPVLQAPVQVDGTDEYEVEDILAHRGAGRNIQYLVRWKTYGPEDDLWLPKKNLSNAMDIVNEYHARQTGSDRPRKNKSHARKMARTGHIYHF